MLEAIYKRHPAATAGLAATACILVAGCSGSNNSPGLPDIANPLATSTAQSTPTPASAAPPSTVSVPPHVDEAPAQESREAIAAKHDLGLKKPIVVPPCNGHIAIVLESIPVDAPDARRRVRNYVEAWEGSGPGGVAGYFFSQASCRSIRPIDPKTGKPFYVIAVGPASDACGIYRRHYAHRPSSYPQAYPRVMSDSVPPGEAANPCK